MTYHFQPRAELYWGVLIAVSLVLLQALLTLQPEEIADWRVWAVAIGGAAIRAGAGAAIDYLRRSMTPAEAPVDDDLTPEDRAALKDHAAMLRAWRAERERAAAEREAP